MLIPFFFLIGTFGGENRIAATTKMIVFTLVGSLLMLVAAIATAILVSQQTGNEISFSIEYLRDNLLSSGSQDWIFCFFAAAFLVKMPAFPIHGWMPDAYRAAPLPVLALLSGVLSKVGAYGFLRVAFPLFPDATARFQEAILIIGVASILYGSVMAFTQNNVRLVAGYSSVAQLGFITVGMLSLDAAAANGSVLQMVNHAIVTVAMFVVIAVLYERTKTEDLREMGGMAMRAPILAALFLVVTLATLAMPGSANFIGEFYILNGLFRREDRLRVRRRDRRRAGRVLRPAPLPADDAQPAPEPARRRVRSRSPRAWCWRRSSPASSRSRSIRAWCSSAVRRRWTGASAAVTEQPAAPIEASVR